MKKKLEQLSKERLQKIILEMAEVLTKEQRRKLEALIESSAPVMMQTEKGLKPARMSGEFVEEKMEQIRTWMEQVDEGELCLYAEEYEDYSDSYWDRDWVVEYSDNQGIGDKITSMIRFAKDCVDDRRYQEANEIYEWLWDMEVSAQSEYDECDPVQLEELMENKIISTDMNQLVLLTLYADYQVQEPEARAEDIYLYFSHGAFRKLHIEDMFRAGREELTETEQFWEDWIRLLQPKSGDMEARLLQEAVFCRDGLDGLVKMADENCKTHPSLYLAVMDEYAKSHDYEQIERTGERAAERISKTLRIRSEVALKAAYAAEALGHMEKVMQFCWEAFWSDSTVRNLLRLFGTMEMAVQYGMRGKEVLCSGIRNKKTENPVGSRELCMNVVGDHAYHELCFYTGDFDAAKRASSNPQGSLGWSSRFIGRGIRLFLLYLYESPKPSMAAASVAQAVGFAGSEDPHPDLRFESDIIEESRKCKVSVFWNYFQRWKQYFPMEESERKRYLAWAEKIACSRADAIVGGQHRGHYGNCAVLLAMVAEIKEEMGIRGAKREIFAAYKAKFPRHSSFQAEMKKYFGIK